MKKEEFYFDSRDGIHKIYAVRYIPDDKSGIIGVLQIMHGMSEHIRRYEKVAEFFVSQGFVVTGNDHLGHGRSVGEDVRYGYFCEQDPATVVLRDAHRLKKLTQAQYPDAPYIILGHSMGSMILRNYLSRYGTGIEGAVIVGTGTLSSGMIRVAKTMVAIQKVLFGPKHISEFLSNATFGSYNKRIDPLRTPMDWLSKDETNVDRYLADPMCGFTFTVNGFGMLAELNARNINRKNLEKIPKELPLLLASGTEDPVGEYGQAVQETYEMYRDLGIMNVSLKMYEGDRHEILNEADSETVMKDILDWIKESVLQDA